ncbi:cache domain-containing sensor histidine kinase [Laedolimicola sp.]|uniref:cache domain-containing sensor histidine kinase n=1 Tax=Laedolimicola sp. TaxID=2981663 RepID=UPI003F8130BE
MNKRQSSLLARLLMIGGLVLMVLVIAYLVTTKYVADSNRKNLTELNKEKLSQICAETDNFCDFMNHVATNLVYSPLMYQYLTMESADRVVSAEKVAELYQNAVLLENNIAGLYIYNRDGELLLSLGEQVPGEEERLKKSSEIMAFGNVFSMGMSQADRYLIYFPVYDLESKNYGDMLARCAFVMKTGNFDDMLEHARVTDTAENYILDGKNRIVAARGNGGASVLLDSMLEDNADYEVEIRNLAIEGWRTVSRIPSRTYNQSMNQLTYLITVAYILAVLALLVLLYFCYRYLVRPLHQIDTFIRHIMTEPEARMEMVREDEIGTVINSLNRMLDERERHDREMTESRQKLYEMELSKKQLQLLAYRNQINPHFLYNTLDCIRAMALYHDADEIAEITMSLSRVFRYAIKGENVVTVEKEISYIREYARIIEYRFMGKIRVAIHMEEAAAEKPIIKLILQPLVENAVFHGLEQTIEGGTVQVKVEHREGQLIFRVEDDGCGIEKERLQEIRRGIEAGEKTGGIGMSNIYQRLKLFYGEQMEFQIESEPGKGTRITIRIPDVVQDGRKGGEEKNV